MDTDIEKVVCRIVVPALANTIRQAAYEIGGSDPLSQEATQEAILKVLTDFLTGVSAPKRVIHMSQLNTEVAANFFQLWNINTYLKMMRRKKSIQTQPTV